MLATLKEDRVANSEAKWKVTSSALTRDSILTYHSGRKHIVVDFENIDALFPFIGSYFYFWPLTTSRNYPKSVAGRVMSSQIPVGTDTVFEVLDSVMIKVQTK